MSSIASSGHSHASLRECEGAHALWASARRSSSQPPALRRYRTSPVRERRAVLINPAASSLSNNTVKAPVRTPNSNATESMLAPPTSSSSARTRSTSNPQISSIAPHTHPSDYDLPRSAHPAAATLASLIDQGTTSRDSPQPTAKPRHTSLFGAVALWEAVRTAGATGQSCPGPDSPGGFLAFVIGLTTDAARRRDGHPDRYGTRALALPVLHRRDRGLRARHCARRGLLRDLDRARAIAADQRRCDPSPQLRARSRARLTHLPRSLSLPRGERPRPATPASGHDHHSRGSTAHHSSATTAVSIGPQSLPGVGSRRVAVAQCRRPSAGRLQGRPTSPFPSPEGSVPRPAAGRRFGLPSTTGSPQGGNQR
jgi:hypothetical protein